MDTCQRSSDPAKMLEPSKNNVQHEGYPVFFFTVITWKPAILICTQSFWIKKMLKNYYVPIYEVGTNIKLSCNAILKNCDSIIFL